jgi:hypothetical protein
MRILAVLWAVGKTTEPNPTDQTLQNLLSLVEMGEQEAQAAIEQLSEWYMELRGRP